MNRLTLNCRRFALLLTTLVLLAAPEALAGGRKALVIGNAAYPGAPLKNPVNDATAMEKALTATGFAVTRQIDLNKKDLRRAVNGFVDALAEDDTALVFYAGHGIEMKGDNYLLPVDFAAENEEDAVEDAYRLQTLLDRLSGRARAVNIVLLDACRNDPFSRKWSRSAGSRGFRVVDVSAGNFVAFSASPGQTAADAGGAANSPFTAALVRHLATPGLDINDVLRAVRADVLAATDDKQNPWSMDNLTGGFRFVSAATGPAGGGSKSLEPGAHLSNLPPDPTDTAAKLRDETRREEEARKRWAAWRLKMKSAFDEAVAQERKDLAATTKARWFESFLTDFADNDPTSGEDERLRADAQARAAQWRGEAGATARREAEQAQAAAEAERRRKGGPAGLDFVSLPGGTFQMGSDTGDPDERPVHAATVAGFELMRLEVSVAQYRKCVEAGQCPARTTVNFSGYSADDAKFWSKSCNYSVAGRDNHPINCVDAKDADAFCAWAGGRLPTETEWEYASRGRPGRTYPWGEAPPDASRVNGCGAECVRWGEKNGRSGWARLHGGDDGWPTSAPVSSFAAGATPEGLLNLAGNVWEWTGSDHCGYAQKGCANAVARVLRGGGWFNLHAERFRGAFRSKGSPTLRLANLGFRCAR